MEANDEEKKQTFITRSRLVEDLSRLGLQPGQTVMLHASVKEIGWIVGGPDVVLQAILDVLTPEGTLMMLVSWEDHPYHLAEWPEEQQQTYLAECPAFDPTTSRADHRDLSILSEYLRTWPGAVRSSHPLDSFAAVGKNADWMVADHPLDYGYGPGSPLEKLVESGGKVLSLGAPHETTTLIHYAECLAEVRDKRLVHYKIPILRDGQPVWVEIEEFDTSKGIVDWPGDKDYFAVIVGEYLATAKANTGEVGTAPAFLLDAADLTEFARVWMERAFNID